MVKSIEKTATIILHALILVLLYVVWTHTTSAGNIAVMSVAALLAAVFFSQTDRFPRLSLKKIVYAVFYIGYVFIAIIKSNLDVARRVVQINIPINPGIVAVKTKLKSRIGRMILANSITLTPGTLSVDIKGDHLYIHWIDVSDLDEEGATHDIVSGFEKYLEVIFG